MPWSTTHAPYDPKWPVVDELVTDGMHRQTRRSPTGIVVIEDVFWVEGGERPRSGNVRTTRVLPSGEVRRAWALTAREAYLRTRKPYAQLLPA